MFVQLDPQREHSVYLVEEVDKLLEVYLVVGLYACYFNHCINFIICYLLAQDFKNLFKVLSAYVSLPKVKIESVGIKNNLLLTIEHGEGKYQVVLGKLIIRTRVLYYVYEVVELYCFLSVRKLHHRGGA